MNNNFFYAAKNLIYFHIVNDFIIRLYLKDSLPLTEEHFVFGDTPANLRLGLDIGGTDVHVWNPEMEIGSPELSSSVEDIRSTVSATPPPFIYDFVEDVPLN